jgi:hypothetical protein
MHFASFPHPPNRPDDCDRSIRRACRRIAVENRRTAIVLYSTKCMNRRREPANGHITLFYKVERELKALVQTHLPWRTSPEAGFLGLAETACSTGAYPRSTSGADLPTPSRNHVKISRTPPNDSAGNAQSVAGNIGTRVKYPVFPLRVPEGRVCPCCSIHSKPMRSRPGSG